MRGPSRALLIEQLQAAITDCASGRDEPFEVAVLAGLFCRRLAIGEAADATEQTILTEAERLRESGALTAALPDAATALDAVDELQMMSEADLDEERCEPLFDLDDLCAGAAFVDQPTRYADAIAAACTTIRATPELWHAAAVWVREMLSQAPPLPNDPALEMWRCVEACFMVDISIGH